MQPGPAAGPRSVHGRERGRRVTGAGARAAPGAGTARLRERAARPCRSPPGRTPRTPRQERREPAKAAPVPCGEGVEQCRDCGKGSGPGERHTEGRRLVRGSGLGDKYYC
ncbi:uncharacterized protein LOC103815858 isoform X2 [Serinus canaria]|uniref:uncharacterized protein LOC103815858 isoform X2 n=1 Tax=Serinus canaria TaxID=9135 RepID=UPI0021CCB1BA|nr:uncharacterized protein LOC103815858 isoform X2 [Serinus canaria]